MNALELADKLTEPFADDWREEAATMLRQQDKLIDSQYKLIESQGKINRALTERIVELEAELKLIDELVRGKK